MSSGTGISVLDEAISATTNAFTYGTVGYGKNGIKKGVVLQAGVDGLKEVTGAAAAEDANEMAREQAEIDRNEKLAVREQEIAGQERTAVARSRKAYQGTVGNTSNNTSSATSTVNNSTDFLGL